MCIKLSSEICAGIMSPTTPMEPEKPRILTGEAEIQRFFLTREAKIQRLRDSTYDAPTEDAGRDSFPEKRRPIGESRRDFWTENRRYGEG